MRIINLVAVKSHTTSFNLLWYFFMKRFRADVARVIRDCIFVHSNRYYCAMYLDRKIDIKEYYEGRLKTGNISKLVLDMTRKNILIGSFLRTYYSTFVYTRHGATITLAGEAINKVYTKTKSILISA